MDRWSRMFPGLPEEVGQARAFARGVLDGHALVDSAELVVSEFATNAVVHTLSGQWCGPFIVMVEADSESVRVSVMDMGADTAPEATPLGCLDVDREYGRGLALVSALAKEWGYESVPAGLRVWAELVTDRSS